MIFIFKYSIIGFFFALFFVPFNLVGYSLLLYASVFEEHALFVWILNSKNKFTTSIKFPIFMSVYEIAINGVMAEGLKTAHGFFEYAIFRIPATLSHIAGGFLAYFLIRISRERSANIYMSWMLCVSLHWIWNIFMSPMFACGECVFE